MLTVYLLRNDSILLQQTLGDRYKFSARPVPTRPLVVPIPLASGATYEVFVNVDTDGRRTNPVLLVMERSHFYEWELGKRNELFLLYVFLALLAVVTFYLAWLFRDHVLAWLSAFFAINFLIFLCTGGFATQYLWPEWPAWGSKIPGVAVFLSFVFAIGFARAFLAETVSRLWIDRVLLSYMGFSLLLAIGSVFDGRVLYAVVWLMYRMIPITFLMLFATLVYALYKRQATAPLFLFGVVVCIAALLLLELPDEKSGHVFNNRKYLFTISAGFLLLAFAAIDRLRRWKEYEKELQINRERERIARDLHDNIGAQLTSLTMGLRLASKEKQIDADGLLALQEHANATLLELRDTLWVMTKEKVTVEQLLEKVESLLWRLRKEHEAIEFILEAEPVEMQFELLPEQAINLYRILQESINNSLKHSSATRIGVRLRITGGQMELRIYDNGKGFDTCQPTTADAYGLNNMRKRAEELPATFEILSAPGEGTQVTVGLAI
jgi:signal transduction histidine kinase